ncbi:MAG: DUF1638 domain-containing protein [Acidimicrobiales bacterium]|nr:DUF1638 domain-containing protein [Acidimicrobiales bacterium]
MTKPPRLLVLGCGALAREFSELLKLNGLAEVTLEFLPAALHNRPENIPIQVRERLEIAVHKYDKILLGYGDCGTGGGLDALCDEFNVVRLPGAHCYEFYLDGGVFEALHDSEPATFYLTDYLAKHFDRLVFDGLGITSHPELLEIYFGNYKRVVFLTQTDSVELRAHALRAATKLGLPLEVTATGYGQMETAVMNFGIRPRKSDSGSLQPAGAVQ